MPLSSSPRPQANSPLAALGRHDEVEQDIALCVDAIARRLHVQGDDDLLPLDLSAVGRVLPPLLYKLLAERASVVLPMRCTESLSATRAQCVQFDSLMKDVATDAGATDAATDAGATDAARRARARARLLAASGTVPMWHRARVALLRDERDAAETAALEACELRGETDDAVDAAVLKAVRASTRDVASVVAEVAPAAYVEAADDDARAMLACDVYVLCGKSMVARVRTDVRDDVAVLQALVDVYDFPSAVRLREHLQASAHPRQQLADPEVAAARNAKEMRRASRRQARAGSGAGGGVARVLSLRRQRDEVEKLVDENRKLAAKVRRLTAVAHEGGRALF